ncbi:MAG: aldo/keto reductase [Candidatus Hydrogenedentes bacterium]|nr:aldo/keto reductase [Candidatus Hydrogenedentota bacterium]
MKRREFMGKFAASAALAASGAAWRGAASARENISSAAVLPRRSIGASGIEVSVIGFSGIVARDNTPEAVAQVVHDAIEAGVNYFDTAASYGNSQEMLAPALKPFRKDIVLATKTRERTREGARREFEQSCAILGTDYFDLYLVHGIQHVAADVDPVFAAEGAMEYLLERRRAGQIRLLGFSAHSDAAALAALDRHPFDFFYYPVSYAPWLKAGFGPSVLAAAREKSIPCIALKALARQKWPEGTPSEKRQGKRWYEPIESREEASLALRWALSQAIVSVLPPGDERLYREALALRDNLSPITVEETERLGVLAQSMNPLFPRA